MKKLAITLIPISALTGENLKIKSEILNWYHGPTLVEAVESLSQPKKNLETLPLRVPIQDVYNIPNLGIVTVGFVESGVLRKGVPVVLAPTGLQSEVLSITLNDTEVSEAKPGENIGFKLKDLKKEDIKEDMF